MSNRKLLVAKQCVKKNLYICQGDLYVEICFLEENSSMQNTVEIVFWTSCSLLVVFCLVLFFLAKLKYSCFDFSETFFIYPSMNAKIDTVL